MPDFVDGIQLTITDEFPERGYGVGVHGVSIHGRSTPERPRVGAYLDHHTVCSRCRKRFLVGDCVTVDLAPNMSGIFYHTDCNDPKRERFTDD